jgi:hypothetical protein
MLIIEMVEVSRSTIYHFIVNFYSIIILAHNGKKSFGSMESLLKTRPKRISYNIQDKFHVNGQTQAD